MENDMLAVSKKLDKFDFASAPPAKTTKRRYTKKNDTPIYNTKSLELMTTTKKDII